MDEITNTLLYAVPAGLLLFLYIKKKMATSNKNVTNLTGAAAKSLLEERKDIYILDVRTVGEFKSGHMPNAKNIPVQELENRISEIKSAPDKPIFVYCASGGRSPKAISILLKNKFSSIYHMEKGLSSWPGAIKK